MKLSDKHYHEKRNAFNNSKLAERQFNMWAWKEQGLDKLITYATWEELLFNLIVTQWVDNPEIDLPLIYLSAFDIIAEDLIAKSKNNEKA